MHFFKTFFIIQLSKLLYRENVNFPKYGENILGMQEHEKYSGNSLFEGNYFEITSKTK